MEPVIIPRSAHTLSRENISPEALRVLYGLKDSGYLAYLAGGGVRDLLLGRKPKDFDVVTNATPNEVRKVFRNSRLIGRRFRLAHVFFGRDRIIEVATFRAGAQVVEESEDVEVNSHHVKRDDGLILRDNLFGTPEQDALRRDFTVNALFYNIQDYSIIDYVGGLEDLHHGVLRFIGEPGLRCVEDPVRMVRAVRFAAMLGLTLDPAAADAIREHHDKLALANRSRLYEEVQKLFFCGAAQKAYALLRDFGLFEILFPEIGTWLGPVPGGTECRRVSHALQQVDEWRQEGRAVSPALLFALMFGGMHEVQAGELSAKGEHPGLALHSVTMQHFGGLTERVQVPKMVRYRTAEILASQPRLISEGGMRARPLAGRDFFPEAVSYLEFCVRFSGQNSEALGRAKTIMQEAAAGECLEGVTPRSRRGRRGRRSKAFRARRDTAVAAPNG